MDNKGYLVYGIRKDLNKTKSTYAIPGGQTIRRLPPTLIPATPTSQPLITSPEPKRKLKPLPLLVASNTLLFCFNRPS